MTVNTNINFSDELLEYIYNINFTEHAILQDIRNYNKNHKLGNMQIAKYQMDFIIWLSRLIKAKNYLEIGVFTGYSSTAMALNLPADSHVVACDINEHFTEVAKIFWKQAGVVNKIKLYLQPALITLDTLINEDFENFFDIALIDADKLLISDYVDKCFKLIKSNGVIIIDNTLYKGRVLNSNNHSSQLVQKLNKFNINLKNDKRFFNVTLPMSDGLTVLLKN